MYNISEMKYNISEIGVSVVLLSDLNPYVRYAGIHRAIFNLRNRISICYDCRLFFFDHTPGSITIFDQRFEICNKTVVYLPPETEYKIDISFQKGSKVIVLDFDLTNSNCHISNSLGTADVQTFDEKLVPRYSLPQELEKPIVRIAAKIEHMLTQCADDFLLQNAMYRENASALLKLCILELIRQNSQNAHSQLCRDVLAYIHANYTDPTITNREIAQCFNYHPDYLSTLIREETGKSLHQYLLYYRLQIAKNYLITTRADIREVAWRCGFTSTAYFIKLFRQNTGCTPQKYRKQNVHTEL